MVHKHTILRFCEDNQKIVRFSPILILSLESSDDYEEINYTFTFNPLSPLEFGNVYNERCMTPF
jgi:hypothetical protein